MVQKNWIIEGKNRINGERGGGSKITQKNRTSFMNDPLTYSSLVKVHATKFMIKSLLHSLIFETRDFPNDHILSLKNHCNALHSAATEGVMHLFDQNW